MKWLIIALAALVLLAFPSLLPALAGAALTMIVAFFSQPLVTTFVLGLLAGLVVARKARGWSR